MDGYFPFFLLQHCLICRNVAAKIPPPLPPVVPAVDLADTPLKFDEEIPNTKMGLGKCISFQIMAIWIYLVYLCQIFWRVDITLYKKRIALCRFQSFFPCCFFFTKTSRIETQKGAIWGWKTDVPSFTHLFWTPPKNNSQESQQVSEVSRYGCFQK